MMKKFSTSLFILVLSAVFTSLQSCSKDNAQEMAEAQDASVTTKVVEGLPNYRYVDTDTILMKYNLAKDYNEEMMRMQDNIQSQVKKHQNSLQSLGNTIQNKMQNNGYLSEASYKQDMEEYSRKEQGAQNEIAKLQADYENAFITSNKTVIDSIKAFIKIYNEKKGYDAIFLKDATMYINPALDITDEVVEGLNARYNKVK